MACASGRDHIGLDLQGFLAGPWFEGQMTGCLVKILKGTGEFHNMLMLVLGYVCAILIV